MKIVLTGASGFIGNALIEQLLGQGHQLVLLGRSNPEIAGVQFARWDATEAEAPADVLEGAEAVIHLAGEPVAQRWTREAKRRIRDSRIIGTRNLVSALAKLQSKPRVMVAASAIGYYGDRGDRILTEDAPPGDDFLALVCVDWENESRRAAALGIRTVMLRFGVVLAKEGGALAQMVPPFKAGVGGPAGSGKQWVSWIHRDDAVDLIVHALFHEEMRGPANAVAPNPVRNADFAKALGSALNRPSVIPTPAFALKLLFGELAGALLSSARVQPESPERAGYRFRHAEIDGALGAIFSED